MPSSQPERRWDIIVCDHCGSDTAANWRCAHGLCSRDENDKAVEPSAHLVEVVELGALEKEKAEREATEAERDQWKRAANGDRDGVIAHAQHMHVVEALVAERKGVEAGLEQARAAAMEQVNSALQGWAKVDELEKRLEDPRRQERVPRLSEVTDLVKQERQRIRFAMAETAQPWTSADLDAALSEKETDQPSGEEGSDA